MTRTYRIFIINPGSTSTKLSLFENDQNIYTTDVFHDSKSSFFHFQPSMTSWITA